MPWERHIIESTGNSIITTLGFVAGYYTIGTPPSGSYIVHVLTIEVRRAKTTQIIGLLLRSLYMSLRFLGLCFKNFAFL